MYVCVSGVCVGHAYVCVYMVVWGVCVCGTCVYVFLGCVCVYGICGGCVWCVYACVWRQGGAGVCVSSTRHTRTLRDCHIPRLNEHRDSSDAGM